MKTSSRLFLGLALALGFVFTGCDSGSSTSPNSGGGSSDPNSPVGTWSRTESATSTTTVLTFGSDKSYREEVTVSSMGVSSVTRYTGTWSTTGDNLSVTFTKTEVNANGSGWVPAGMVMPARTGKFVVAGGVLSYDGTGVAMRYVSGTSGNVPAETILPPVFSPAGGTFAAAQSVTITAQNLGALVYYTRDGSTPSSSSTLVTGAVTVSATSTLRAIAILGSSSSSVASATFTIQGGGTTDPGGNTTHSTALVGSWTGTEDGVASVYTFGADGSLTVLTTDPTAPSVYRYERTTATWSTSGANLTVSWTKDETSADMVKWTVATDFTPETVVSSFSVSGSSVTITSEGQSFVLTKSNGPVVTPPVSTTVEAPLITPNGGRFTSAQTVAIVSSTAGAAIYYTLDGTAPTKNSTLFSTGILTVSSSKTVKAIAVKDGVSSAVTSATFDIQTGGSTGGNTGGAPAALLGSWVASAQGYTQTDTYAADGTYTMTAHDSETTEYGYLRASGTFVVTGSKIVRSMKKFEMSDDGKIWVDLGAMTSEETGTWSVSGSILTIVSEAGETMTMTKSK